LSGEQNHRLSTLDFFPNPQKQAPDIAVFSVTGSASVFICTASVGA
jgi:hypothetical protein